jgi:UDP-N-acetylmuramyl tripeptide synthase
MLLRDVIAQVPSARFATPHSRDVREAVVQGLTQDPTRVTQGSVFVCLNDRSRENPFASFTAVARGASAVICEPGTMVPPNVPRIEVQDSGAAFAQAAAAYFGHPAKLLSLVGVECATAVAGETRCAATNVTWLLSRLLRVAGAKTAVIGELGCEAGGRELPLAASQLDAFELHRLLDVHRHAGGSACVVQQPAVHAHRWGRLACAETVAEVARPEPQDAFSWRGSRLVLNGLRVSTPLVGAGNAAALRSALGVLLRLGIRHDRVIGALPTLPSAPGFLEPVSAGQPFGVFVDAARTACELTVAIRELRAVTTGRIIVVAGPMSEVTAEQRRGQGTAAGEADVVFATSDNPGDFSPELLLADFVPATSRAKFVIEADRAQAIERAIRFARANDVVLLAGKGHRRTQEVAGTVGPFDDAAHAVEALALRGFGGDL